MPEEQKLPSYNSPPITEVALSLQFERPNDLNLAHLGAFWWTQKGHYPKCKVTRPIPNFVEQFGNSGQWMPPSMRLSFSEEPEHRVQMISENEEWMLQIQVDRLVVNWRKGEGSYPRFGVTLAKLQESWASWEKFLAEAKLGKAVPSQWEVTYVDRIPKAGLWETPSDWPNVLPGLWPESTPEVSSLSLRSRRGQWVWDNEAPLARIYIEPAPHRDNDGDSLILKSTARGPTIQPAKADDEAPQPMATLAQASEGLNLGRSLVVSLFDAIISPRAKKLWERQ